MDDLTAWCTERGWRTSLQGRKVYCLPAGLTKAAAAAEIARRTGASTTLAAGDSLLDIDLLEAADPSIRPAHGELHGIANCASANASTPSPAVSPDREEALRPNRAASDTSTPASPPQGTARRADRAPADDSAPPSTASSAPWAARRPDRGPS
ncbi:hypothetical protein [Actinomadura sp. 9N215]|uniref:hypothetical protein n=1 Tax=Actinomadura sp. 9N215 TaxID=3375150 RepID=UPI003799DFC1